MIGYAFLQIAVLVGAAFAKSILYSQATIVGWNEQQKQIEITRNGSLLIIDDRIKRIFKNAEDVNYPRGTEVIDAAGKIITPGFIDTHRHNWQAGWRTMGSNITIVDYLHRNLAPERTKFITPEDIYNAQLYGAYEGLSVGTTTSLEHAHHTWTKANGEAGLRASLDSGARIYHAYALGMIGYGVSIQEQVDHYHEIASTYHKELDKSIVELGIACDVFSALPEPALEPILNILRTEEVPVLTMHMLSGPYGMSNNPAIMDKLGLLNRSMPVVFSHASFMNDEEADILRKTNQYASITIESEMFIGQTNPTAHKWLDQAALGVDSFWTFSSDLLTQIRIFLAYIRHTIFTEVLSRWELPANSPLSASQAFIMATRSGALALRRPDLGIIAEGAKADILVWKTDSMTMLGWWDPVAAIVNFATVNDIEDVLVDGVFKKRNGKLLVKDLQQAKAKFLETAEKFRAAVLATPQLALKGDEKFFSGAPIVTVPRLDVLRGAGDGRETIDEATAMFAAQGRAKAEHDEL
ncbi:hypothetical protein FANTH_4970 [Fusarium anthophilum]|uniref:Amidohydrolase-related domain-containing protein n=1 Tax=Fusarium anthophilum TaxID=48485 RepID=A0A8H4ZNR3_9HYPO|nr:hypothetical protein FANTH_4970 [Fusarium anthophilum]